MTDLRLYILKTVPHVHEAVPRLHDVPGVGVVARRREANLLDGLLSQPGRTLRTEGSCVAQAAVESNKNNVRTFPL